MSETQELETFFASCPRGLENLLVDELAEFGAVDVRATQGGVGFRGQFSLCYRVNLESRIASPGAVAGVLKQIFQ